jgi:hypothetical protein
MTADWTKVSLSELLRLERRPVDVIADREYQEIGTYSYGRGIFHKRPRSGLEVGNKDLFVMRKGDLILQITFAWEGAIALCSEAEDGLYGSVRYPTFRVDEARCFPPFLSAICALGKDWSRSTGFALVQPAEIACSQSNEFQKS